MPSFGKHCWLLSAVFVLALFIPRARDLSSKYDVFLLVRAMLGTSSDLQFASVSKRYHHCV